MIKAPIHKIIHHSLVDGLGNRTSIFLQGCNIKCEYCHNPETQKVYTDTSPSSTEIKWMTAEEVFEEVKKDIPFIRGITLSGGECTLYLGFLKNLFALAQGAGLTTLIDTNGTIDLLQFPDLMEVTTGVMLDVKAWDLESFKRLTGASNKVVKENLKYLSDTNKLVEIRIVCIPEEVDVEDILKGIKTTIGDKIDDIYLRLIKFRNNGVIGRLKDTPSVSDQYMDNLKDIASKMGFNVIKN